MEPGAAAAGSGRCREGDPSPGVAGSAWLLCQPQGQFRAEADRFCGLALQLCGHWSPGDDREAPVVQADQLGKYLGAQPWSSPAPWRAESAGPYGALYRAPGPRGLFIGVLLAG